MQTQVLTSINPPYDIKNPQIIKLAFQCKPIFKAAENLVTQSPWHVFTRPEWNGFKASIQSWPLSMAQIK